METLASISNVQLWEVRNSEQKLLCTQTWSIISIRASVISKVGSVSWNLVKSLHCLKAEQRTYVFAISPEDSLFYCLKLPDGASEDEVLVLEEVLELFTTLEIEQYPSISRTDKVIKGIGQVTTATVNGLAVAANYVGDALLQGAESYKKRAKACEQPAQVSEKTKKRIERVKTLSKMASGVVQAAVEAGAVFTSQAADAIIGSTTKPADPQKKTMKAKRVTAAVVVSAAEIYEGMIEAFRTVSKKAAEATSDVVTHKFGEEAGSASKDTLAAVGHGADAVIQSSRLGSKALLKSTAKKVAVGYMQQDTV